MVSVDPHDVRAVIVDPISPATLYAATDSVGILKSVNSGGSWAAANAGLTNLDLLSLVLDHATPTLYAGTNGGGVFKSSDSGGHWTLVDIGLTDLRIAALAVDATTPSTVYAGTSNGLFSSSNGGTLWVAADHTVTTWAVGVDPKVPSTVYAGTGRGIYKSTDSGGSWGAANAGVAELAEAIVAAVAIDPKTPCHALRRRARSAWRCLQVDRLWRHLGSGACGPNQRQRQCPPHRPFDPFHTVRRD